MIRAVALLVVPMLAGCGESGFERQVNDAIRSQLTDPQSAQFEQTYYNEERNFACGAVNARNRFGGYVGRQLWVYKDYRATLQESVPMSEMNGLWEECMRMQFGNSVRPS